MFILVGIPLLFVKTQIEIYPKTEPKFTFWCSPNNLPYDNETIEVLNELDVGFIIPVSKNQLNKIHIERIENLINNDIEIYFSLNGFADIYIYNEIIKTYKYLRHQKFFDNISGFYLDAEPSMELTNKVIQMGPVKALIYLTNNFPTVEELENATIGYQKLIDLVHKDGKTIGIIKNLEFGVYIDTALENVYYLKLKWDSEINMHYRISSGGGYRRFTDFEMYDNIKYYGGEVMLGSFGSDYHEILIDITIASYLNQESIYLFSWGSFIQKYDLDFLRNMKPYKNYIIETPIYEIINQFFYFHGLDLINIIFGFLTL